MMYGPCMDSFLWKQQCDDAQCQGNGLNGLKDMKPMIKLQYVITNKLNDYLSL